MHRTFLLAAMPPIASIVVDDYLYPPPSSGSGGDLPEIPDAWYGNIQYLLWVHFVFVVIVVVISHLGISAIESRLRFTRFRDGNGNISDPNANSTAVFTIMVQGLPKNLGSDRVEFEECFRQKYPGKVYKIIIPMDLCVLDDLATELVLVRDEITWYGL